MGFETLTGTSTNPLSPTPAPSPSPPPTVLGPTAAPKPTTPGTPAPGTARTPGVTPAPVPTAETVSDRVKAILSENGPLMDMARTQGMQYANSRGLLNSSLAAGSVGDALYRVAVPIASQESQASFKTRDDVIANNQQSKLTDWQLSSGERANAGQLLSNMEAMYSQDIASIMSNENLSGEDRAKFVKAAQIRRDNLLNLTEQMYNIDLQWAPTPA